MTLLEIHLTSMTRFAKIHAYLFTTTLVPWIAWSNNSSWSTLKSFFGSPCGSVTLACRTFSLTNLFLRRFYPCLNPSSPIWFEFLTIFLLVCHPILLLSTRRWPSQCSPTLISLRSQRLEPPQPSTNSVLDPPSQPTLLRADATIDCRWSQSRHFGMWFQFDVEDFT